LEVRMTPIRYPGHLLKTRRQALWQGIVLAAVLLPLLVWRVATERSIVALVLAAMLFGVFATAFRAWRFLAQQEVRHGAATPEMAFAFEQLTTMPLVMGAFLLILGMN
jgi:Ni/Fe-hydrogenase subunit HybB-like protein